MSTIFRDKVTVNGSATWNDPASVPAGAQAWGVDQIDGWDDTADLDSLFIARGGIDGDVHGDFDALRGRHLLLGGYVHASNRAQAEGLFDQIVRSLPRNKELTLTRHEGVPKFVRAYRAAKIERPQLLVDTVGNGQGTGFRWMVPLIAPDPLKYAVQQQTSSAGVAGLSVGGRTYPRTYPMVYTTTTGVGNAAVVTNTGTAETPPVVTLTGPLGAGVWRVSNETTLRDLAINVGLAAGDTMVIDFRREVATVNGFVVSGTITGDFWGVSPGVQNTIRLYADFDPAAGISVTINSAWE